MTPAAKAKIALDVLSGLQVDDAKLQRQREQIARTFRNNAYRAFLPSPLDFVMAALYAGAERKLIGIQIGANDGHDEFRPLFHRYFAQIVLVEPQPPLIEKVKEAYAEFSGRAHIENVAIGSGGDLVLHIPDEEAEAIYLQRMKRSSSAIVTSNRTRILKLIAERCNFSQEKAERHVIETHIRATTIATLALKHEMDSVDFLQIDCEGYDWKAMQTMGELRPRVINFESNILPRDDWQAWLAFAQEAGYAHQTYGRDTIAILGGAFSLSA